MAGQEISPRSCTHWMVGPNKLEVVWNSRERAVLLTYPRALRNGKFRHVSQVSCPEKYYQRIRDWVKRSGALDPYPADPPTEQDEQTPLQVVAVLDLTTSSEALYAAGKLKVRDDTLYMADLADIAEGRLIEFSHICVELPDGEEWPSNFEDLSQYGGFNSERESV